MSCRALLRFFALTCPQHVAPILAGLTALQAVAVTYGARPHIVDKVLRMAGGAPDVTRDHRIDKWIG